MSEYIKGFDAGYGYVLNEIENYTKQFFEVRAQTLLLDGRGNPVLRCPSPIISLTSVKLLDPEGTEIQTFASTDYKIYNRHLGGPGHPDDRYNPRIELTAALRYPSLKMRDFPKGQKNVQLVGNFGFTEYDGVTANGITPVEINYITRLMVIRECAKASDWNTRRARMKQHLVTSETSDGVSYTMNRMEIGAFTGDPEIDRVLMRYRRSPALGAA
jgi:hypothetical protein